MRIAIEGCTHGELDATYETIAECENKDGRKVDLLLCCGDFQVRKKNIPSSRIPYFIFIPQRYPCKPFQSVLQSTRNLSDLKCMACPDKYKSMCSFYKYYSGEKKAPILTLFIGGNHEASNYLQVPVLRTYK